MDEVSMMTSFELDPSSVVIERTEETIETMEDRECLEETAYIEIPMTEILQEQIPVSDENILHTTCHNSEEDTMSMMFKTEPNEIFKTESDDLAYSNTSDIGSQFLIQLPEDTTDATFGVVPKPEVVNYDCPIKAEDQVVEDGASPQQYIILTNTAENIEAQPAEPADVPEITRYLQFQGPDGQTYLFAVKDDANVQLPEDKPEESPKISSLQTKSIEKKKKATEGSIQVGSSATTSRAKSALNGNDGINQAWFTTRDDKAALHKDGHQWKQGQWSKDEIQVLEMNITNYCKDHNIKDPAEVIFETSKDERKNFYRTIAIGIQRPLFSVYRRVTRMYDRKNYMGKYSTNEMKHLRMLRAKHGNDWAAIGGALGRSASSVKDKCRLMKDNCKSGKWYPEEEARLADAVYKLTGLKPSESITSGLSWASVAEHVGTRSEKQCRTKWLNYLNWKQQGGADWTRDDDQALIDKVSSMNANNDGEIDWIALSENWKSVRSPQWLRGKWWALKRHIPDYNKLTYPDLLEQMKQAIYWNIKPKPIPRQGKGENPDVIKNFFPVSISNNVGGLALLNCPEEEGGFSAYGQAFEVLQHWTPGQQWAGGQLLGSVPHHGQPAADPSPNIITADGGHIIVRTIGAGMNDNLQLPTAKILISSSSIMHQDEGSGMEGGMDGGMDPAGMDEGMDATMDGDGADGMDAAIVEEPVPDDNLLKQEPEFPALGASELLGGDVVVEAPMAAAALHHQNVSEEEPELLSHPMFQGSSGQDLVMSVTSSAHHSSSPMTSLKDPILSEKSQSTELTDDHSELTD